MIWLVGLLILLFVPSLADAADKYVRPLGGSYGAEDGTSYAAAFDGFADVSLSDGDLLYVCGLHRETLTIAANTITVDFRCPSDPGSIHGSVLDDGVTGWTGPDGNGNYLKTYTTQPKVVARDPSLSTSGTTATILAKGSAQAGLATGAFFWAANVLYIHENPAGHIYEVGQRDRGITFPNSAVAGLTVIGGDANCSVDRTVVCGQINFTNQYGIADGHDSWTNDRDNLSVQRINFFGVREQAVHQDNATTAQFNSITITGCALLEIGGEGLYVNRLLADTDVLTITFNKVGSASWPNSGWDTDHTAYAGDAIDVNPPTTAGAFKAIITDNIITNVSGNGIVYTGNNGVIERNVITDASDTTGTNKTALFVSVTDSPGLVFIRSNRIYQITRLGNGIDSTGASGVGRVKYIIGNLVVLNETTTYAGLLIGGSNNADHHFINNTVKGGLYCVRSAVTFQFLDSEVTNNILIGCQYPINIASTNMTGGSISFNDMVPLAGGPANPFVLGANAYATAAAFDTGEASAVSDLQVDPLLMSATDYRLQPTSTLRRVGKIASPYCTDARGRPCWTPPDIGAYQATSGDLATARSAASSRSSATTRSAASTRTAR